MELWIVKGVVDGLGKTLRRIEKAERALICER
jgi:hypothetical protein